MYKGSIEFHFVHQRHIFQYSLDLISQKIIDEQYKTFDHTHERHFVDMYFKKIDEAKDNTESSFYCKLPPVL